MDTKINFGKLKSKLENLETEFFDLVRGTYDTEILVSAGDKNTFESSFYEFLKSEFSEFFENEMLLDTLKMKYPKLYKLLSNGKPILGNEKFIKFHTSEEQQQIFVQSVEKVIYLMKRQMLLCIFETAKSNKEAEIMEIILQNLKNFPIL